MGMAPTHEQIAAMSDDDLIARYNDLAKSTVFGTSFYREKIAHRLTWVILVLTSTNAAIALFPLLRA